MSVRSKWKLPKEHGAWGMLYVPLLLGALAAGGVSWRILLLALAATCLFVVHEPLLAWWRAWSWDRDAGSAGRMIALYLGLAGCFALPLLVVYDLWGLLPVGGLALALLAVRAEMAARRQDRTVAGEILAITGMTLTGPAAYYTARGGWSIEALWLWLLSGLYFASGVFYVKFRVLSAHARDDQQRRRIRRWCAAYHSFLLASLAVLAATGSLNLFVLIAFAPVLGRAFWHLARPAGRLNLKRIGWLEVAYSVLFLVFAAASFRQV